MTHFLKTFCLLLLLSGLSGCILHKAKDKIVLAERYLQQGELKKAEMSALEIHSSLQLSSAERKKLDSITDMCHRIELDFTLSEEAVLGKLKSYDGSFSSDRLLQLEKENKVDCRILNGEKRYFKNCVSNIFRLDADCSATKRQKEGNTVDSLSIFRCSHSKEVVNLSDTSRKPVMPVRMKLSYTITVKPGAVPVGEVIRCWMPYPREGNSRQKEIKLLKTQPEQYVISPETDMQRTIYLEQISKENQPAIFHTEISYTAYAQSFQLTPEMIRPYHIEQPIYKEFTREDGSQIKFTDSIKSLTNRILQGESNPLLKVRKLYQWINASVTWASALEYSIISDIPGFVMQKRHGDCGMQTLLFMTMARYSGVPVKWQSGWMLHPGHVNLHDWCEVWYEGIGWVPLDQSFGLQDSQDAKVRDFYMTGIDAYRFIVNDAICQPLTPNKQYLRSEPYDFQRGEVEWKGGNLYFDQWSWHMDVTYE